ncbi:MAG: transposase [Clostridia bacterium]|nr:transposase [Clostridia bacterium]
MSEFTIKQIFIDNWDNFIVRNPELNIRQVVFDEVEKIMNCGNPDYGYALYVCEHCKKFVKVPFRCKSRFCNTCGVKYAQDRAFSMTKKSIRCKHRHIVFTMSDKLWSYFLKYRNLLDGLFSSASSAILSWFYELNKSQNFTPGIMCTLHTFGRDLKWNPHIHMLCTEGGAGNTEVFRIVKHINFKALRFRWQKLLLDYLQNNLPANELPKFKQLKNQIYKEYNNGFYVYAKPDNISSINQTINYVVRYTGRPAMAQSRIIDYDGTYVTYYYERHEDGKRIEEKIHAYEFIKKLIMHIPDKNFKVVRYYGIYAKKHKHSDKIFKLLNKNQIEIRNQLRKWNLAIELSFGYATTICSCGGNLIFFELKIKDPEILKSTRLPLYNI